MIRFFHELKRRNVVRRNTVYAATAFVILELISIIQDPLRLPEWTLAVVIILLSIGLVISLIISWIYDLNPEGGLVKTKPLSRESASPGKENTASSGWKIASYASFVIIVLLIAINLFPRNSRNAKREITDKSIAVIPFINDSPEKENEYFINGTMEAILDNLSRFEGLRVVSRTSVEKYRGPDKPSVPEIARELNVGYILEGSGQKSGDQIRLFVQLLDGNTDEHLWSKDFIREIDDIFSLQSEIARFVAAELETIITPEEEEIIAKIPTHSPMAYEFFQKGRVEMNKYWANKEETGILDHAETLFRYALGYDSTFAGPWVQLAHIYEQKYFFPENFNKAIMDSVLSFAEKALKHDPTSSNAYNFKGWYHQYLGEEEIAREAYTRALGLNPNDFKALRGLGDLSRGSDVIKALEYYSRGLEIEKSDWYVRGMANNLSFLFSDYGFKDLSEHYLNVVLNSGLGILDTASYYWRKAALEYFNGNPELAFEHLRTGLSTHPAHKASLEFAGMFHLFEQQYDSAFKYYRKILELSGERGWQFWHPRWYGYLLIKNGDPAEGERYIEEQFEDLIARQNEEHLERWILYNVMLAEIYAFRGEREKALKHLREYSNSAGINHYNMIILDSPLFETLRDDAEFKEIYSLCRAKLQAKHEKIRLFLEEDDIL